MGEIPHSEKMFHLPIEVSVYVPSTQDVDKVISKSEMKLRVDEVKKYLATLFGGFSSSSVEGGFLASDGKVVKENVERVVSFAPKEDFDNNKEALVQKASEWATKWGQEAIGLEHEGDLYYVPQKFENGGTIAIREAKEMANSQAIKIKHHVSELANILKSSPTIEAWVIAKLESASNDLADVTHYLDGKTQLSAKKMATGGNLSEKMIKVKVDYLEQQYFQLEKEIEISFSEYKEYDKTGKVSRELIDDLISETSLAHHVETNAVSVRLTPITSDKMARGGQTQAQQNKIAKVMGEFKDRELHSSSGDLVTDRKQAVAIALSEAGVSNKMAEGGGVDDLSNYINIERVNPSEYPIVRDFRILKSLAKNGFIELTERTGQRYTSWNSKFGKYDRVTYVRKDNIKSAISPSFIFKGKTYLIGYIKGLNFIELYVLEDKSSYKMKTGGGLENNIPSTENLIKLVSNAREKKIKEWRKLGEKVVIGRNDGYSWEDGSTNDNREIAMKPSKRKILEIIKNHPNVTKIHFYGTIKAGEKVGEYLEIVDGFDVVLWSKENNPFKNGFQFRADNGKYTNTVIDKSETVEYKDRKDNGEFVYYQSIDKYGNVGQGRIHREVLQEDLQSGDAVEIRKMADGGSIDPNSMEVQFIKYKDEEIMYEPHFKEFYVNDSMFHSLEEAKNFIDKGAPMSNEIKKAYRRGLFAKGGKMEFERPSYKSSYVASQDQAQKAQAEANLIADENWNQDYENDPIIKAKKKAKETAIRAGMAYATSGASEIGRLKGQAMQQAMESTKAESGDSKNLLPEGEINPQLAKMVADNPQIVQMLSSAGGFKGM